MIAGTEELVAMLDTDIAELKLCELLIHPNPEVRKIVEMLVNKLLDEE